MKAKIEIKNSFTGIILFEFETENNTVKMLELSKNLESLIAKKNSLLLETTKVPGMAEVIETFNPEEHKN